MSEQKQEQKQSIQFEEVFRLWHYLHYYQWDMFLHVLCYGIDRQHDGRQQKRVEPRPLCTLLDLRCCRLRRLDPE